MPLGPLNVCTSLRHMPAVERGTHWYSNQLTVIIGNIELDLAAATLWLPPQPSTLPAKGNITLLAEFITANTASNHGSPANTIDTMINTQLECASRQLQHWLTTHSEGAFPENLIGCGTGLTPAGDDILVGTLVALQAWRKPQSEKLIAAVKQRLDTTSELSAAHLLAACDGAGIDPLHQLLNAIATEPGNHTETKRQVTDAAMRLANYGHSSGYYAMKGILLAATCLKSPPLPDTAITPA